MMIDLIQVKNLSKEEISDVTELFSLEEIHGLNSKLKIAQRTLKSGTPLDYKDSLNQNEYLNGQRQAFMVFIQTIEYLANQFENNHGSLAEAKTSTKDFSQRASEFFFSYLVALNEYFASYQDSDYRRMGSIESLNTITHDILKIKNIHFPIH